MLLVDRSVMPVGGENRQRGKSQHQDGEEMDDTEAGPLPPAVDGERACGNREHQSDPRVAQAVESTSAAQSPASTGRFLDVSTTRLRRGRSLRLPCISHSRLAVHE